MDTRNTFKAFHTLPIAPLEIQDSLREHLSGMSLHETLTIEDIKSIANHTASVLHPEHDHASSLTRMKQITFIHQIHVISIMRNQPLPNLPVFIRHESEDSTSQEKSKPDPDIDALFCEW